MQTRRVNEKDSSHNLRKLVVVADDFEDSASLLAELLESDPRFRALPVTDGISALELVLTSRPDIAILDLEMPKLDGVQVAKQIHERLGSSRPLLVALTGRRAIGEAVEVSVFDHVLRKPPEIYELLDLLASS